MSAIATLHNRFTAVFRQAAAGLALMGMAGHALPAAAQTSNSDLVATIDSVVRTDSQAWWINSYDRGSISSPQITSSSADGRSYVVRARYTYNSGVRGYVDLSVRDGRIVCLQYWDSSNCNRMRTEPAPWADIVLLGVGLTIAAAATSGSGGNGGGSSSGYSSGSNNRQYDHYEEHRYETPAPAPREDTSVGCAWGDRRYGTC